MVAAAKFESTLGRLAERFEKRWGPEVGRSMFAAGEFVAGAIRREIASWPGGALSKKTGNLARSFLPVLVKNEKNEVVFGVFSKLPYARIQDQGGTIHPKSSQNLAIPLTPAARRVSPRSFPNLVPIKGRSGRTVLATVGRGKNKQITPQYVLVPSVTLTGHQYLDKVAKETLPKAQQLVREAIQRCISGAT